MTCREFTEIVFHDLKYLSQVAGYHGNCDCLSPINSNTLFGFCVFLGFHFMYIITLGIKWKNKRQPNFTY